MQSQVQQTSKKNKVNVPFYSPPCRFYGQTSADIIKEARAAVITTSSVGIKPVFTSRPFTPNQKERTLFGNLKKNKCRPPSSFSLRHLKNEELSARVKLPSIDIGVPRRKNYSTFQYSKNLSLDNLTEDYDAEVFEEVKSVDAETLPTWKKSHSCPREGRLSKVASLNDIHHSCIHGNSFKKVEYFNSRKKGNLEANNYDLGVSWLFGDSIKSDEDVIYSEEVSQYSILTKGGGDYKVPGTAAEKVTTSNDKRKTIIETSLAVGNVSDKFEQEDNRNKIQISEGGTEIKKSGEIEGKDTFLEQNLRDKTSNSKEKVEDAKNELKDLQKIKQFSKNENVAEKSIVTGSRSEYLMSLKAGYRSFEFVTQPEPVPLEILELHETARYYGVNIGENDKKGSAAVENSNDCLSVKVPEKLINNSQLNELIGMKKNEVKENFKDSHIMKSKSQSRVVVQNTSENVECVMNDKKRYHIIDDKGDTNEKTYKKWNNKKGSDGATIQPNISNDNWDLFWKNSYYRDKEEKEENNQKDVGGESLQPLVSKIVALNKKGAENQEIYETISQLYRLIKNNQVVLNSKSKENISRALYLYVDNENPEVLLCLAKVFFLLKEENFLSVACKILFKVARFDTNDHLFLNEEDVLELFLEGIGRASPLDCAESCIYSYGALKFLTLNHSILSRILHMGALDLMALHLKIINSAYDEKCKVSEQTQHALFQLTGALRHVAAGEGALSLFLTTDCINILWKTLRFFYKDEDIIVNISRTLSLLSTDEIIIQALMQIENILTVLIDLIERYRENDKILIRLAFCLGNIVEHSDLARVQLSRNDASLTVLLNVLKLYIDKDLEISLKEGDCPESELIDDVMVKIIRIIANMSMNPIVGSNLSPTTKEKKSLQLSKLLSVLLMRKDPGITLLATLGCLNNISYYCNSHSVLIDITQGVERVLGLESVECQIEAARVLGNLTRHREIRDLIYSTGGVDLLSKLLSSPEQEVVRCACGALVNMMLDSETRKSFVKAQGIDKLIKTVEVFPNDWPLASLVARAIWNSCGDDMSFAVAHNNMEHLLNILVGSLEEENWNDGDIAWEEFASVATDLLEKISSHLEST